MKIQQINLVNTKAFQRLLESRSDVFRAAIRSVRRQIDTKFSGEENLVAFSGAFEPGQE